MNSPAVDQNQKALKPSSSSSLNLKLWQKNKLEKTSAFLLILAVSVIFLLHYHPFEPFSSSNLAIYQESKKNGNDLEKTIKREATKNKTVIITTSNKETKKNGNDLEKIIKKAATKDKLQETKKNGNDLEKIIERAATKDKTVILTTSNKAWSEPKSILDVFLESFKYGNNTSQLLKHLVIISLDENAHNRCLSIHPHCYFLKPKGGDNFTREAFFMTPKYLNIVWTKIRLMSAVLQLGYNFVFTDADIVWLQDPFPHFHKDADVQISCDLSNGNPDDRKNKPNSGFIYARSNKRSIKFYKYWYSLRLKFPDKHDQDVLDMLKIDPFIDTIGLKMKFLDTKYFSGFCQQSKDFNKVCTMHANCCVGLQKKIQDLRTIVEDFREYMLSPQNFGSLPAFTWRAPIYCRRKKVVEGTKN